MMQNWSDLSFYCCVTKLHLKFELGVFVCGFPSEMFLQFYKQFCFIRSYDSHVSIVRLNF